MSHTTIREAIQASEKVDYWRKDRVLFPSCNHDIPICLTLSKHTSTGHPPAPTEDTPHATGDMVAPPYKMCGTQGISDAHHMRRKKVHASGIRSQLNTLAPHTPEGLAAAAHRWRTGSIVWRGTCPVSVVRRTHRLHTPQNLGCGEGLEAAGCVTGHIFNKCVKQNGVKGRNR